MVDGYETIFSLNHLLSTAAVCELLCTTAASSCSWSVSSCVPSHDCKHCCCGVCTG